MTASSNATSAPSAVDLSERLAPNFTLGELLASSTAERHPDLKAEQMNPPQRVLDNLRYLTETTLQPLRDMVGHPILVTSGYRCERLNDLVGGSSTSQHVQGEAADCKLSPSFLTDATAAPVRKFIADRVRSLTGRPLRDDVNENFFLFAYILLNLKDVDVDQVIHEYGEAWGRPAWIHVAASRRKDGRQILAVGSYTSSSGYQGLTKRSFFQHVVE